MWSVMWWKVVLEGNSETQTVLFLLPSISFSMCVCAWQRQFPAMMARSLAGTSVRLTLVHTWPPSTTVTTSAVGCSSTSSGCSPLPTVGTSKCALIEEKLLSNITRAIRSVSFTTCLVWFWCNSFFPLRQKMNTKNICRWLRLRAFQPSTICWGHLLNLKIKENSKNYYERLRQELQEIKNVLLPHFSSMLLLLSQPLCHADHPGRPRSASVRRYRAAPEDRKHHLAPSVSEQKITSSRSSDWFIQCRENSYIVQLILYFSVCRYDYQTLDYDIMLIKLYHPVEVTDAVAPIPLPTGCPMGGLPCSVSGWGNTAPDGEGGFAF